jgi:hypothetical protein
MVAKIDVGPQFTEIQLIASGQTLVFGWACRNFHKKK